MRNCFTNFALVAVVSVAGAGLAHADQWDKKTTITIDEAVQMPNVMLQPGTYVLRLNDAGTGANRHVVQIFDKDEKHVVTTILAIPNERLRPTGKSVFQFWEVPAGQPKAMRAWFYPGDNFGQEFAYPKTLAVKIEASNAGQTVPVSEEKPEDIKIKDATPAQTQVADATPAPAPAPVAVAEPTPAPAAPVEAQTTTQQSVEVAQNTPAPEPAQVRDDSAQRTTVDSDAQRRDTTTATNTTPAELPKTASNMPLLGLLGLLSLAGAAALKVQYNRG